MATLLNPYLSFRDDAREAMEFYQGVFGGELTVNTFGELHGSSDPAEQAKVMHAQLVTDGGLVLMGADTPQDFGDPSPNGSISLSGEDEGQLRGFWDGLSAGATIGMPLERAPWGDTFGMLTDRFGVAWMVNVSAAAG